MEKHYDVVIIGGGVSGCSCAWNCARRGLKTLIIEKKSYLGGAMTGGLVVPMMKTDDAGINVEFFKELVKQMQLYDAQITYSDMNKGWFNPEILKIVLEEMVILSGAKVLYNSDIYDISTTQNASVVEKIAEVFTYNNKTVAQTYNEKIIKSLLIKRNVLSYYVAQTYNDKNQDNKKEGYSQNQNFKDLFLKVSANFFVDASGDAIISELLNLRMQPDNNLKQAETLRFIMSGVDTREFSKWLLQADSDRNVTSVTSNTDNEFYMTTAYTWDESKNWGLSEIFHTAVENGDLEEEDTQYFQLFGIAKMPSSVAFNCPRLNPDLPYEAKLIAARKSIYRIANFCKFYFPGFENAYISQIADEIGVRVSNRPLAVYNYTVDDIKNQKKFRNTALHSNYPIDIHSEDGDKDLLETTKGYDFPVESLISSDFYNLFNIGKAVGADFKSQAALRVQKSCLSMGEALAKYISAMRSKLNK